MNTPVFSVIICSIDPLKFAQASECYRALLARDPHEIIGIHDARSLAEGYNRGLKQSSGDIVILSHDDILILDPAFGRKIRQRLRDFDLLGFAGTSRVISGCWFDAGRGWIHGVVAHRHDKIINLSGYGTSPWPVVDNIQAIDGMCMMARRTVALEIGFDEATFDDFHLYDLDFSYSAWRAGKKLGVCCDIPVIHQSSGVYGKSQQEYARRFVAKHGSTFGPCSRAPSLRPEGLATYFSGHQPLLAAWQFDILQRASIAERRRHAILHSQAPAPR
ncbi:MAG: glycosyltransferase family protein [Azoarcus sp.]|jgi:glycosyltransferase involved in cell wall biosynthesis|nr:glycosyltransferase family protein [Azoarcus sp.]